MPTASEKEVNQALGLARRYADHGGDVQQLARLALYQNLRVEHLEHFMREVEHYLEAGQSAAGHAHLLRAIAHYRDELQPKAGTDHQTFGLD